MAMGAGFMVKYQAHAEMVYSTYGATLAEEALRAVRTTIAFCAQSHIIGKFGAVFDRALYHLQRSSISLGFMLSCIWASVFWVYALALWQDSRETVSGEADIGKIIVVITAILLGSFQPGIIAPNVRFIVKGISAASILNEAIDRNPVIDGQSDCSKIRPQKEY